MKNPKEISIPAALLILLIASFCIPRPVYGIAFGQGSATILWDSLQIIPDQNVTIVYDKYQSRSNIQGSSPYLNQWRDNWTSDNYLMYQSAGSDFHVYALAVAHAGSIRNLHAEASVSSNNLAGTYLIKSTAQWWANFHVIGSGNIRVALQYHLDSTSGSTQGDEAWGYSLAYNQFMNYTQNDTLRRTAMVGSQANSNIAFYSDSLDGWLYTDLSFVNGDSGAFNIWAQAFYLTSSPIITPEPSAMLLLGSGLVGLIGFSKGIKRQFRSK